MKDLFPNNLFFLCLFFITVSHPVWANEGDRPVQFQEAASSYSRGDYQAAIRGFESLVRGGISAPLLYNLANSYAQAGQSGRAILNYERALRLAPGDSDIRGNLELVRRDKGLFQEEQSYLQRFVSFLGLNQWLGLATTAFVLFVMALLLSDSVVSKRRTRFGFAASFLFVTGVASVGTVGQYQHWQDGVVVASDARIRVSPFDSAASTGSIQEGRTLHPGKSHNNYVLIVDETGRRGWLAADAFELIATP